MNYFKLNIYLKNFPVFRHKKLAKKFDTFKFQHKKVDTFDVVKKSIRSGFLVSGNGSPHLKLPHLPRPVIYTAAIISRFSCFIILEPLLDGFVWHFQLSVHFPLTIIVDKYQQHQNNFFENAENRSQGCWVRSKNATSVLHRPRATSSVTNTQLLRVYLNLDWFNLKVMRNVGFNLWSG